MILVCHTTHEHFFSKTITSGQWCIFRGPCTCPLLRDLGKVLIKTRQIHKHVWITERGGGPLFLTRILMKWLHRMGCPQNCLFPRGILPPTKYMAHWAHPGPQAKHHLNEFSHFSTAHGFVQQTDTDQGTWEKQAAYMHSVHAMCILRILNRLLAITHSDYYSATTQKQTIASQQVTWCQPYSVNTEYVKSRQISATQNMHNSWVMLAPICFMLLWFL